MGMTKRGVKRLWLLVGVLVLGAGGVGGLWVVRNTVRESGARSGLVEGTAAYEAGQYDQAFAGLNRYVRTFPENPDAWYMLADARRRVPQENNRHLTMAANFGTRALEIDPAHSNASELLLEVYPQLGQYLEASRVAKALLARTPEHSEALWVLIQSEAFLGNRDEALGHAQDMIQIAPQDMRPRRAVIELLGLLGSSTDELLAQSSESMTQDPENLKLLLFHAELLYRFGKADEAADVLATARQSGVEDAETLATLVTLLDQNGFHEDAEQIILDAQRNPAIAEASRGMQIERLWKQGRLDEADQLLQAVSFDEQSTPDALLGWAAIVAQAQGDEASNPMLQHLRQRSSSGAQFWRDAVHALALMQQGQWSEAVQVLGSLEPVIPESDRELVEFWRGVCMRALGERSRAAESFRMVLRLDPTWDQPAVSLAQTLLELDRLEEAFALVRQRLQFAQHPERDLVSAQIATRLIESNLLSTQDAQQVQNLLQESVRQDAPNGTIHALLARAQIALGQTAQAKETIDDILDNNRLLSPASMRNLHSAMTAADIDASGLIATITSQDPSNPDMMFVRAMESAKAGRLDEGKTAFREALEQNNELGTRRAFAAFLDKTQDAQAGEQFRSLSDDFPDSARAQQDVLESAAAWLDEQLIEDAIHRLQVLTGNAGEIWRIFESRRLLVFHRDAQHASDATLLLREIVRQTPPSTTALILMSDAMFVMGNEDEGIVYLEQVILNEPSQPAHYPPLIEHLQRKGRLGDAERWLRDYLQLEGLSLDQRRQRATMLVSQGLWGAALPELRALATTDEPNDLVRFVQALTRRGETQEAERAIEQLLNNPKALVIHWGVAADFYASQGKIEDGLAILDQAPFENQTQASLLRGSFYERHDLFDEASEQYQQASQSDTTGEAWEAFVSFHVRTLNLDLARSTLQQALAAFSQHEGLLALQEILGSTNEALSSDQIAQLAARLGANVNPVAVQALLAAAGQFRTTNGSQESLDALEAVVDEYSWYFPAWRTWISALLSTSDAAHLQQAVDGSRRALSAMPNEPRIASIAYEVYMRAGLFSEAANAAREWKLRSPTGAFNADLAYASAMQQQGAFSIALGAIELWAQQITADVRDQPDRAAMYISLLVQTGSVAQAEALLFPLALENEQWARTMVQLARVLPQEQDTRQRWYEFLVPQLSKPGDVLLLVLFAHESGVQLGSWWFERVLEHTPALLENQDARFDALRFSAAAADQLGSTPQALEYYKQALEILPQDALTLNNLAYLIFTSGESLDEAEAFARRAVASQMPVVQLLTFHDTLGEILLAQGKLDEATEVYQQGLVLDPASKHMQLGMAEVSLAAGAQGDARVFLDQIRDAGGFAAGSPYTKRFNEARATIDTP